MTQVAKTLNEREQAVIDLYQAGKTLRQIADAIGMTHQGIHRVLRRPHVREILDDRIGNTIQRVLERASKDLPEMLRLEAEIARMSTDPKADAVRLKAIQGRIARHTGLVTPVMPATEEEPINSDEAIIAGLNRIRETRPDLLAAASLRAEEPITAIIKPWESS